MNSTRQMERRRRIGAVLHAAMAVGLTVGVAFVASYLSLGWKALVGSACGAIDGELIHRALKLWKRAQQAAQGAYAEELIEELLQPLTLNKWQVNVDIQLDKWGNVDFHLVAPNGKHFAIVIKSDRGTIVYERETSRLMKRYGKQIHPFVKNKDILKASRGQAATLSKMVRVRYITPILCFTRATVQPCMLDQVITKNGMNRPGRGGVYITDQKSLVRLLLQLVEERA